jgi:putative FmdB family regulatory protein
MPTYEYQCEKCGHEFERDQRITDEPVKKCPSCRAARVKRLISTTSFVLKGGGWYSDLYSSGGKAKTDGGEAGGSKAGASEGESKAAPSSETTSTPASGGSDKPTSGKSGGKPKSKKPAAA